MDQISIYDKVFEAEIKSYLKRMGTSDEKWVAYNNVVRKYESEEDEALFFGNGKVLSIISSYRLGKRLI